MVSHTELSELLKLEGHPESPILTIYINVDQSSQSNLNRGYETALKNSIAEREATLPEDAKKAFRDDVARVMEFIANYTPQKKSLVIFCDASHDLFWERSIRVPLENRCFWEKRPYMRPLIEAQDEYERYGLILTDRAHARLFTIALGEIEENKEAFATDDVKRFDASGSDHMLSQSTFQRNADEHARWHLKKVAEMMGQLAGEHRFDRLVLGGPKEAVTKLHDLLSTKLQKMVIGTLSIGIDAKERDILDATMKLVAQREREDESQTVDHLITAAAKQQQAVVGLRSTMEAAVEGRIMSLVYSDEFPEDGFDWKDGRRKYAEIQETTPEFANGSISTSGDLLEWLVTHVARQGGAIEQVKDGAADVLKKDGQGIGAFLRF